jgi:hypothetical protein
MNALPEVRNDSPAFPLIIAEFYRKAGEVVRISLDNYNGRHTIDVRVWYRDGDDALKPSKAGLTLGVKHLPALADAMVKALAQARQLGLLDDGGAR